MSMFVRAAWAAERAVGASVIALVVLLVIFSAGLISSHAHAHAHDRDEVPGYRDAIEEAMAEYSTQNYPEARALFERAHRLDLNARTFRGLAAVSYELRRYSECISFCDAALASQRKPLDVSMQREIEKLRSRARGFVGELALTVEPADSLVAVDGAPAERVPKQPLQLDVGVHELEFQAPGHESSRHKYTVIGGENKEWSVRLRKLSAETSPSSAVAVSPPNATQPSVPPRQELGRWQRAVGRTLLLVGAASSVVSAVLAGRRRQTAEEVRALAPIAPTYSPRLEDWQREGTQAYLAAALGSAALTAGALGLLLSADRAALPRWASTLAAVAGVGLAAWGTVDVARGSACAVEPALRKNCLLAAERRDRGGRVLLSAAPLLIIPIAREVRFKSTTPAASPTTLQPQLSFMHRNVSLSASLHW